MKSGWFSILDQTCRFLYCLQCNTSRNWYLFAIYSRCFMKFYSESFTSDFPSCFINRSGVLIALRHIPMSYKHTWNNFSLLYLLLWTPFWVTFMKFQSFPHNLLYSHILSSTLPLYRPFFLKLFHREVQHFIFKGCLFSG